jgi:dienelactone hydrolase
MAGGNGASRQVLDGWTQAEFGAAGLTHPTYRRGSGPGVILLPEIPGMTPEVMGLAERLVAAGFTVVIPSLAGTPGRPLSAGYAIQAMASLCVSREFRAFALNENRPVAAYLRALARQVHQELGGPGVGMIGMCFSGGFALAAAVEPAVLASVLSQPGIPVPLGRRRRQDPGLSTEELDAIAARAESGDVCALGLRFTHDRAVPAERFATLRAALGDAFESFEIDSGPGNPHQISRNAHSVLSGEFVDKPGHPTVEALQKVIDFLRIRLTSDA